MREAERAFEGDAIGAPIGSDIGAPPAICGIIAARAMDDQLVMDSDVAAPQRQFDDFVCVIERNAQNVRRFAIFAEQRPCARKPERCDQGTTCRQPFSLSASSSASEQLAVIVSGVPVGQ